MKQPSIQNIYDDPDFFSGYKKLRQNNQGFNDEIEQKAIRSLLPNLEGASVLDIGCGFGNFCYFLSTQKIKEVIGLDPSQKMIAEAKRLHSNNLITYQCCPIETASFSSNQFDLVVSSVALHYVEDYAAIVKKVAHWLKPNGYLIFSVEHPICTANPLCRSLKDKENTEVFPLYNYRDEGRFHQTWFIDNVQKYHRTLSTTINTLLQHQFSLCSILEPMPTDELIEERPAFAVHKIRPPLLIIKAQK
ncbi:MAG: class I SAM-dependent methyltransferase [Chthoniobacterales bacterium]|nr:class I SAM-dependent methyltransferase [Chthoniobacterales bacterium]